MGPEVSICIPAYEQPELLRRTIESVLVQDYQDFEIIVTDDSESDEVYELVRKWSDDSRFVYRRNAVRLGSPANWNAAMDLASTDLIKFLHHDDWLTSRDSLGRFVEAMQMNPAVTLAFSAANACENDGSLIFLHAPSVEQVDSFRRSPLTLQFANFIGAPSATIFRKRPEFAFDTKFSWVVDIDAYIRLVGPSPQCIYLRQPLVSISSNGAHQLTRKFNESRIARAVEHLYIYEKLTPQGVGARWLGIEFLWQLLQGYNSEELAVLSKKRAGEPRTPEEIIVVSLQRLKRWGSRLRLKVQGSARALLRGREPMQRS